MPHPAILLCRPRAVALLDEDWAMSFLADFARPRPRAGLMDRAMRVVGLASDDQAPLNRTMAAPQVDWAADPIPCAGYMLVGAIAVIDVKGLLTQEGYYDWWDDVWIGGYAQIGQALRAARADARVKALLLRIDSPGGLVDGCFELADEILQGSARNGGKPVWASVMMACSAAYAILSACDHVVAAATVYVGSIGVYMLHLDQSKMLEMFGLKLTEIVGSGGDQKTDFAGWKPLSDAARADGQAFVDETTRLFYDCVGAGRDLSADDLRALKARAFMAQHSDASRSGLALKLVDEIGSEREAAAALAKQAIELPLTEPAPPDDTEENDDMDKDQLAAILASKDSDAEKATKIQALAKPAAAASTAAVTAAQPAIATAVQPAVLAAAAQNDGFAVLELPEAKGREALAQQFGRKVAAGRMTLDEAKEMLGASPKASRLADAMAGRDQNPGSEEVNDTEGKGLAAAVDRVIAGMVPKAA